jgi:glycosyltransferase involved in cell wall biosynthesis
VLDQPEARVVRSRSWIAPASCDLGGMDAVSTFRRLANEADVIHYHFPWPFADFLHACVRPSAPGVMTYHSDIVRQRWLGLAYGPLMRSMFGSMRAIVSTSSAYLDTSPCLNDGSVRRKVSVIPLGFAEDVSTRAGDPSIFARLGITSNEPYFLFIGVLRYYKGLDTLVRAAALVNCRVVIAGSGPEERRLKSLTRALRLQSVVYAGSVNDEEKWALLRHARAFVLPSHLRSEAFGMAMLEAAALGRPIICCEIGTGTSYVNQHRRTGFVVQPGNADELAAAMASLLADESLANEMGSEARERFKALFSLHPLGSRYSGLYRSVLDTGGG